MPMTKGQRILAWVQAVLRVNAVVLAINLASGILAARVMGPANKGIFNAIVLWPGVFSMLGNAGLSPAFTSLYARAAEGERRRIFWVAVGLSVAWGILSAAACALLAARVLRHLGPGLAPWVLAGAILSSLSTTVLVANALLSVHESFAWLNWLNVSRALVSTLVLVLLAVLGRLTPYAQVVVTWTTSFLASAPVLVLAFRTGARLPLARSGRRLLVRTAGQLTAMGFRFYAITLASMFNAQLDQMIASAWLSAHDIGLYGVASSSLTVVAMVAGAFGMVFFPMVAGDAPEDIRRRTSLAFRRGLFVFMVAGCVLLAGAWPMLCWVYGPRYVGAWPAIVALVPAAICGASLSVLYQGCYALRRFAIPAVGEVVGAASGAVLLWWWIPRWGIAGAGLAGSVSYLLDLLVVLVLWSRQEEAGWRAVTPTAEDLRAVARIAVGEVRRLGIGLLRRGGLIASGV